jgi:acylpyruvate hydrolase
MKIICIGQNYPRHNSEMKSETPQEPVFFMKPDTACILGGKPFFYPEFSNEIHHEVEIVLKISKNGKHIDPVFAGNYYEEIGIGIDFTARDLQAECKKKGWPWEKAKAFDGSAPLGKFVSKKKFKNLQDIPFHLDINEKTVQTGCSKDMLFSFDKIIGHVSRFVTLRKGDLIFTGTPEGVGPVKTNDRLKAYLGTELLLQFDVK